MPINMALGGQGEVQILGQTRKGLLADDPELAERLKVGMVFQNGALFDSLTVGENVGFMLYEHTALPHDRIEVSYIPSYMKLHLYLLSCMATSALLLHAWPLRRMPQRPCSYWLGAIFVGLAVRCSLCSKAIGTVRVSDYGSKTAATDREGMVLLLSSYRVARISDILPGVSQAIVAESLSAVGLSGVEQLLPSELSGGMRKRVALARAIVRDDLHANDEQASMTLIQQIFILEMRPCNVSRSQQGCFHTFTAPARINMS